MTNDPGCVANPSNELSFAFGASVLPIYDQHIAYEETNQIMAKE